jgi:hypothetical protein
MLDCFAERSHGHVVRSCPGFDVHCRAQTKGLNFKLSLIVSHDFKIFTEYESKTDNTPINRTKGHTMIYKTRHRKLKIEQHEPH